MNESLSLFPPTYEASRERFRANLDVIRERWPRADLSQYALRDDVSLTIDWIGSDATVRNEKVLIFTTGEHGVEGYVGSAMLQRFLGKFLSRLDPRTTGLLLVHAINPWGMKHHRRVNAGNVDLNRNFLWETSFDPTFNPEYDLLAPIIHPGRPVRSLWLDNLVFYLKLAGILVHRSWPGFKEALLLGQYRDPRGLFYGGEGYQEETRILIEMYRRAFTHYDQYLQLDMHTGYGPRYQMSLVNSALETTPSGEFERRFGYPLVVAANPDEFYAIRGDMIDFVYALGTQEFPGKRLYAVSFEFGTLGDKLPGKVGTPRAMSFENRLYWQGARTETQSARIKGDFEELFNPPAPEWRAKALADADRAFEGILRAQGYLT